MDVRILSVRTDKPYYRAGLRHEGKSHFIIGAVELSPEQMTELAQRCEGLRSERLTTEQVKEIMRELPATPLVVMEKAVKLAEAPKAGEKKS